MPRATSRRVRHDLGLSSYRRHSDEFKLAVVTQSLLPNASVSRIAREHNINANQVFAWRKLFGDGQLAPSETACALLPVEARGWFMNARFQSAFSVLPGHAYWAVMYFTVTVRADGDSVL